MAWSSAIDAIVDSGLNIMRSFTLEFQNGYEAGGDWTEIPIKNQGFTTSVTEGVLSISTLRSDVGISDFTYFNEFDHMNPFQLAAACRLKCIVYLKTITLLGGTITLVDGSQNVVGVGTTFLADFQPGDLLLTNARPAELMLVYSVTDNLNLVLVEAAPYSMAGAAYHVVDAEREYMFRGVAQDKQEMDLGQLLEAHDPLFKLNHCLSPVDEEADLVTGSPFANATLRQAPNYDTPPEVYHFEVDPTAPGQAWAENPAGLNRAFRPGLFIIERWTGAAWELEPAGNYQVCEPLGLIIFLNDQGPAVPALRLVEVSVYQEGTLELEDVMETILRHPWACPDLGFGAAATQLEIPCTGLITFVAGGPPYVVTGAGTLFLSELEVGERISLIGAVGPYGIVENIINDTTLWIRYEYGGLPGANGPFYKSTLRASGVSISSIRWRDCQGYAADLIRELQKLYADFRGYRLWYDHMEDWIVGRRVAIDIPNAIDLGPSLDEGLPIHSTLENLYTAIAVKGTVGRVLNLMTDPLVVVTDLATPAGWSYGAANPGGAGSWGGMSWGGAPGAEDAVGDGDLSVAFMVYRLMNAWDIWAYYDLVQIDLGAEFDLSRVIAYAPNCKNKNQWDYGISIFKADNPAGPWTPLTPESYQVMIAPDEGIEFECEGVSTRYLKVAMRAIKWVSDGGARTMGLREIQVFGSEELCHRVCIQNVTPPGPPPYTEGQGGHFIGGSTSDDDFIFDYYPNLMSKMAHVGHLVKIDDTDLVMSEAQAMDRGYILLNEYIRLYREINWRGAFDPRIKLYDTVRVVNTHRPGMVVEELFFLVESLTLSDADTTLSGHEWGAGVLE